MFVFCSKKCPTLETNAVGPRTLWDKMFQPVGFTFRRPVSERRSHRGLRPRSVVGETRPRQSEHAGAEGAQVPASPFSQVGQEFLGEGVGPAERQHLHGAQVEVRRVRARPFVGQTRGEWSQLGHAVQRLNFLQGDGWMCHHSAIQNTTSAEIIHVDAACRSDHTTRYCYMHAAEGFYRGFAVNIQNWFQRPH